MSFELNFEKQNHAATTGSNVLADMHAVARLNRHNNTELPPRSLEQMLSHDSFPQVIVTDRRLDKSDFSAPSKHGLHEFMHQAVSTAHRFHAAIGVNLGKDAGGAPKQGSGCPDSALRNVFFGRGRNNQI